MIIDVSINDNNGLLIISINNEIILNKKINIDKIRNKKNEFLYLINNQIKKEQNESC